MKASSVLNEKLCCEVPWEGRTFRLEVDLANGEPTYIALAWHEGTFRGGFLSFLSPQDQHQAYSTPAPPTLSGEADKLERIAKIFTEMVEELRTRSKET